LSDRIGPFFAVENPGQGSEVYPQRPHPKDAVKRMLKATMPIIHRSSDFMVLSPLLTVIG
jgi:hypothetical protein